jgi:uncharacterized protein YjbI with pentapeptide repeats
MTDVPALQAPDLPELEEMSLAAGAGTIDLSGARVTGDGRAVQAGRVQIRESELRGVVLEPDNVPGLTLADVVLRDCGMSNLDGREGRLIRVEAHRCQFVGFGLDRGDVRDLRVVDSSMQLASFASAALRTVVFERVNLAEASFMHARLESVAFVDCRLDGADFRHAKLTSCAIRGTSLDGVLGVQSLAGVRMPWPDILASAAALAAALGISIESD